MPPLWPQIFWLSLVNAAVSLAWLMYQLHLGKLLVAAGMSPGLAGTLLVVESLLAIALEPLFGFLSDRSFRARGTRWPLIAAGVGLSAVLLAGIPLLAAPGLAGPVLVGALVAWAVAMTVFRAPVLALLGQYASADAWPLAAGLLSLFGGIVAALRPTARDFLVGLGPAVCFAAASGVLVLAALALWTVDRRQPAAEATVAAPVPWGRMLAVFVAGAALGLASRLWLGELFPRAAGAAFTPPTRDWLLGAALVLLGMEALVAGRMAQRFGNDLVVLVGAAACGALALVLATLGPASLSPSAAMGRLAALAVAFAPVANGAIPFALQRAAPGRRGLALGCWFGGIGVASAAFGWLVPKADVLTLGQVAALAVAALGGLAAVVLFVPAEEPADG